MTFKKQSTNLKRAMWWKNFRLTLLLIVIAIVRVSLTQRSSSISLFRSSAEGSIGPAHVAAATKSL